VNRKEDPLSTLTSECFTATLRAPFTPGWSRLAGLTVDGSTLTVDPSAFFFRYENPTWIVCDWEDVKRDLLGAVEQNGTTIEQMVCDYVTAHGRTTTDPAEVLAIAEQVYAHMFRDEWLDDPELDFVPENGLVMLREASTLMALNRVELNGHISNASPAWMLCVAMETVYDLDSETATTMDEIYHGTWFNEYRRRDSLLAHAALGGRLVHGCQGAANQSGGVVVQFGTDMARFRAELSAMRMPWIEATRSQ
jgi:hypothetical protein